MTYAAAITRLKALTFTDLVSSFDVVDHPPTADKLPALVIDDKSQPFVDQVASANIPADKTNVTLFIDHILCIEPSSAELFSTRYANITKFLDLYLAAITANMTLNNNLIIPLQILVIQRGTVFVRKRSYSGIIFRHKWTLRY